ncbi:MAG: DUF3038 domain-containing protein [Synechococcaceae cyanobacterium]|nr:DUF3038 domain-containing protein [Synechococcaceae cyanobacterium]
MEALPPPAETAGSAASPPLGRRGLERLDLMLLCMEALDSNGGEAMVWMSGQLGYQERFPNRVELWKRRCHNPLRRACRRGQLDGGDSEALIHITCQLADRLYPLLRSLLCSSDPPDLIEMRWNLFRLRLGELLRQRMNPRRSGVQALLAADTGQGLVRQLIQSLTLAAGPGGVDRLRASLRDAVA